MGLWYEILDNFLDKVSLYSPPWPETLFGPGWPQTHRAPLASASQMVGLKMYTTMPGMFQFLIGDAEFVPLSAPELPFVDLEFVAMHLPLPPQCWKYRYIPPHTVYVSVCLFVHMHVYAGTCTHGG